MHEVIKFGFIWDMQSRRIKPHMERLWAAAVASGNMTDFADEDFLVFDEWSAHNIVPYVGQNYILNAAFSQSGVTPVSGLYVGLHSSAYTCLVSDTFASFLSSATEVTGYSGGIRLTYSPDTVANGSMSNTVTPATFTFTGSATINGGFLSSTSTQGSSSGYLISAVRTASAKSYLINEQVKVIAGLTLTSA